MIADDFQDPYDLLGEYGPLLDQIKRAQTLSPELREMMCELSTDTERETLLNLLYGETFTSFSNASNRVARYPLDEIGEFLVKLYAATGQMNACTTLES
jgi:hypothetical protein